MNHLSFTAYRELASNTQINGMDPHYYDQTLAEDVGEQEKETKQSPSFSEKSFEKSFSRNLTHLNVT